ncbi:MAG: glycosyltransferase, partial [Mycoplasmoidaceae bacterium]
MHKSFTIIIPCFNVEKYISKCLESLLNQNYDTNLLQILVIDDGST